MKGINILTGVFAIPAQIEINNLAGKYESNYGTPFDLEELSKIPEIDVTKITHVRIIDVIGTLSNNYATRDSKGRKINDQYPTQFPSGGFDLDAVGVIPCQALRVLLLAFVAYSLVHLHR